MLCKNVLCNTNLPIHDQSCCANMFCATQVCTKYDSIHAGTWLHNFSWVLRAIVYPSFFTFRFLYISLFTFHKAGNSLYNSINSRQNSLLPLNAAIFSRRASLMFLYQRLDSNWHMLCNLTNHNANELRNSRVVQTISQQFWFYATDCANCQSAPYTVNQLHNTQCCATWLIVNGPLKRRRDGSGRNAWARVTLKSIAGKYSPRQQQHVMFTVTHLNIVP
jgi:hypothetical protein